MESLKPKEQLVSAQFISNPSTNLPQQIGSSLTKIQQDDSSSDNSLVYNDTPRLAPCKAAARTSSLIRITRPFRIRWDLLVMVLSLYTTLTVPFFVAFKPASSPSFILVNTIIDLLFIADICMNFFTTYIDKRGEEVFDRSLISKHYLQTTFFIDLVASVPLDNVLMLMETQDSEIIILTDLLKLLRILRLNRIIRFTRTRDDTKAILKLIQLILYLLIWVHLTGCLWFFVVRDHEEWVPIPDFVTGTTEIYSSSVWEQYFMSFYHGIWLLTGGEVGPRNSFQAFLASMLIIIGALINAILFGEFAVLMGNMNRFESEFQDILDGVIASMNNMKIPPKLSNSILDYISQVQGSLRLKREYETFQKLISPSLQQEVNAVIYEPIITKNSIFSSGYRFKEVLTHKLQNKFTKPEEEIIKEGATADSLYFLVRGECKVYVKDWNRKKQKVCFLSPGAHFGEIAMVYNTSRTATIKGNDYCTLAELSRADFSEIASQFPQFICNLKKSMQVYNDEFKRSMLDSLGLSCYFNFLPPEVFSLLPYYMNKIVIEKNSYLFLPGQIANHLYVLIEGELELSMTINERHLHMLKNLDKLEDSFSECSELSDYDKYKLNINSYTGLKPQAEVVPFYDDQGAIKCNSEDDGFAGTPIGKYPQEIVLANLNRGSLVSQSLMLNSSVYQTQCKATTNSVIYAFPTTAIEDLKKENKDFRREVYQTIREKTNHHLDYEDGDDYSYEKMWKNWIVMSILKARSEKHNSASKIASMIPKIRAITACEQAGNFELSNMVITGQILPHMIKSDGTVDDFAYSLGQGSLPMTHPIMKIFSKVVKTVKEGEFQESFQEIQAAIRSQSQEIQSLERELSELRGKIYKEELLEARIPQTDTLSNEDPPEEFLDAEISINEPFSKSEMNKSPALSISQNEDSEKPIKKYSFKIDTHKAIEAQELRKKRRDERKGTEMSATKLRSESPDLMKRSIDSHTLNRSNSPVNVPLPPSPLDASIGFLSMIRPESPEHFNKVLSPIPFYSSIVTPPPFGNTPEPNQFNPDVQ